MQAGQAQAAWARGWGEESRVVAVRNPNLPQLRRIGQQLVWYWATTKQWTWADTWRLSPSAVAYFVRTVEEVHIEAGISQRWSPGW